MDSSRVVTFSQAAALPYASPTAQFKAAEVGLKLTAGFEMVCANRARFGRAEEDGEDGRQGAGKPAIAQTNNQCPSASSANAPAAEPKSPSAEAARNMATA